MNLPPLEESIRCPKRIANALLFGDSPPPKNKLIEYIVISRKFQYLKKKIENLPPPSEEESIASIIIVIITVLPLSLRPFISTPG